MGIDSLRFPQLRTSDRRGLFRLDGEERTAGKSGPVQRVSEVRRVGPSARQIEWRRNRKSLPQ
ncbi:hypothetical protein RGE_37210 [Rubrivivax gelatinosus IL144]|uniref:Uncharacterized protein n=1 Tax=Rubrivivax gelatinosus (strain NBRC 100245 / IL144) TaxID=983917 RepID=I0HVM3_RUBGI|nr:hypothetical protein RGE_37210 [Rubrivivax gelatinosus IL144]